MAGQSFPSSRCAPVQAAAFALPASTAVPVLEQQILAEYLRTTHATGDAPQGKSRLAGWLDRIEEIIRCPMEHHGKPFKYHLELLGLSHGQDVGWICQRLKDRWPNQPEFAFPFGGGETLNLPYLSWLLRLADIMDLDGSRAPAIVLKHLGIRDGVSVAEWQKHRAVVDYRYESGSEALVYHAPECPNPYIEKRIRETVQWINAELRNVEWERVRLTGACLKDKYAIALPREAQTQIDPAWEHGRPSYEYHDYRFELRQDEILEILMGEQLYGEPELCIRELLQNALDALELRNLRLRLPPDECLEPVDPLRPNEELHVELTWGEEDGRPFIRVRDNGVGMTRRIIEQYFTQVGHSYYRSSEFEAERAAFQRHGRAAAPISRFGIGILSCFMLADQVVVKTCPCGADRDRKGQDSHRIRKPYEVRITGAGSLFWLREWDDPPGPGTEITLYLKSGLRADHDADGFHVRVREHFGYVTRGPHKSADSPDYIDPAFEAARAVVWPKYPIQCRPDAVEPGSSTTIRLDDRFHFRELLAIDDKSLEGKAASWGLSLQPAWLRQIDWRFFDWEDEQYTGTRIRLAVPVQVLDAADVLGTAIDEHAALAAAFSELQLPPNSASRAAVLIAGMQVEQLKPCSFSESFPIMPKVGGLCWIDLRGAAAPVLRADRKAATRRQPEGWKQEGQQVWQRFAEHFSRRLETAGLGWNRLFASAFATKIVGKCISKEPTFREWRPLARFSSNASASFPLLEALVRQDVGRAADTLDLDLDLVRDLDLVLVHDLDYNHDLALGLAAEPDLVRVLDLVRDLDLVLAPEPDLVRDLGLVRDLDLVRVRDRGLAINVALPFALARGLLHALDLDLHLDFIRARDLSLSNVRDKENAGRPESPQQVRPVLSVAGLRDCLGVLLRTPLLNEAFQPSLQQSLPAINDFNRRGHVGHAVLLAPLVLDCQYAADGCTLVPSDPQGQSTRASTGDYDLVSPLTAIPLGPLRALCPRWMTERLYRALAMLPFVFFGKMKVANFKPLWSWYREHLIVPDLLLLLPDATLLDKRFTDWTSDDWANHVWSAYWRIDSDTVLWAPDRRTRAEMKAALTQPQPDIRKLDDWIGSDSGRAK